jgi:hypothetical protein
MSAHSSSSTPQSMQCLFRIHIHSLEDIPEFDQHKQYSLKFTTTTTTQQSSIVTPIQTVQPHFDITDDIREDYQFINNHLNTDDTASKISRRAFRNSFSNRTMMKDSSMTSNKVDFNEKIEFVENMQWNINAFEDVHASPLQDVLFRMELREVCFCV